MGPVVAINTVAHLFQLYLWWHMPDVVLSLRCEVLMQPGALETIILLQIKVLVS